MKIHVHLLIAHFLITTTCTAMEKEKISFPEITIVKNPRQAFFLTQNRAVVNGDSGCSIVDLSTRIEIKKISDSSNAYLAIHPNKSVFALAHSNSFYIYDAQTGNLRCDSFESRMPNITSAVFNHSDLIFLSYKENDKYLITRYIHNKNCYEPPIDETIIDSIISYEEKIHESSVLKNVVCHPTQKERVYLIHSHSGNITYIDTNNVLIDRRPHQDCFSFNGKDTNGEFNSDGSLLACYNPFVFFIIDTKANQRKYLVSKKDKNVTQAITFHSEGSIIAALSDKEGIQSIDYWDVKNKEIILSTLLPKTDNTLNTNNTDNTEWSFTNMFSWFTTTENQKEDKPLHYSLSFSPDQKHLMIIAQDKCFLVPVPIGITCRTDKQEKIFLYWLLNNHQVLPNDVTRNITNLFLEILKR